MKLIMKTEFENLRLNKDKSYSYDIDRSGDREVLKIYHNDTLIAKRKKIKKSVQYFGVKGYEKFLTEDEKNR